MNWYLVVGETSSNPPQAYKAIDVAYAFRVVNDFLYPNSGPWKVVFTVELDKEG